MSQESEQKQGARRYHAFLLRVWQEAPSQPWRASLQDAATQQQRTFADLEQLVAYLRTVIDATASG